MDLSHLGIDLGTSNTTAAAPSPNRSLVIDGDKILPSIVEYPDSGPRHLIGRAAQSNGVQLAKRALGRKFKDVAAEITTGDPLIEGPDGEAMFMTKAGPIHPTQVVTDLLRHVIVSGIVENFVTPNRVVITVPANFTVAQKEIMLQCAKDAGCDKVSLLTEPVAASLFFFKNSGDVSLELTTRVLVYDVGAGTTDVAIVEFEGNNVRVLSVAAESVGGSDVDAAFAAKTGLRIAAARFTKEELSTLTEYRGVTRQQLEEVFESMQDRFIAPVTQCMDDADVRSNNIDYIVMVGGTTLAPWFKATIDRVTQCNRFANADPFFAVARGAAIHANNMEIDEDSYKMSNVLPLSLGIESMSGKFIKILRRGTPMPCSAIEKFKTFKDFQEDICLRVFEGERGVAEKNRFLCKVVLSDFKLAPRGELEMAVEFKVDDDGLLHISTWETRFGKSKKGASVTRMQDPGLTRQLVDEARENAGIDRDTLEIRSMSSQMAFLLRTLRSGCDPRIDKDTSIRTLISTTTEFMRTNPSKRDLEQRLDQVRQFVLELKEKIPKVEQLDS